MATVINTLYPPVVNSFAPAFVNTTNPRIYFSLSPYNSISEIKKVHLSITNQESNSSVLSDPIGILISSLQYDDRKNQYFIEIPVSAIEGQKFITNQFYKVQIRFDSNSSGISNSSTLAEKNQYFLNNLQSFSEWSQVCLIKAISQPELLLRGFDEIDPSTTIAFNKGIMPIAGRLTFDSPNETETLQSYSFDILEYSTNKVVLSTPTIYTGANVDPNGINYKLDIQGLNTEDSSKFKLRVTITTKNQYIFQKIYDFQVADFLDEEDFRPTIDAVVDNENGIVTIKVYNELTVFGTLYIKRASSLDNFKTWEDISISRVAGPIDMEIHDNTIGSLVWYRYTVQLQNSRGVLTPAYKTSRVFPEFYDAIFSRDDKQLKIKYNYAISNLKPTVNRAKIDTLGGKYPKFAENAVLNYKSFSVSGSISATNDDAQLFMNRKEYFGEDYRRYLMENQYDFYEDGIGYLAPDYSLFVDKETAEFNDFHWEREFREAALAWLNDGEPKLYRSMAEGNIVIMLTDVSIAPITQVGRRMWTFSATAYEIAEGHSLPDLDALGIYTVDQDDALDDTGRGEPEDYIIVAKPGQIYTEKVPAEKTDVNTSVILQRLQERYAGVLKEKFPDDSYLQNVKIFFQSEPHAFIHTLGGWEMVIPETFPDFDEQTKASVQMGYTFIIKPTNGGPESTIFVNTNGFYQIPDTINVQELIFPQTDDVVTIEYIVVFKEKLNPGYRVSSNAVDRTVIGQEYGIFQPMEYVGESIMAKYNFIRDGVYSQRMRLWKGISLDVTPFAIAEIQYYEDNDKREYVVGSTGLLNLIKDYKVIDMRFMGRKMNKKPINRQPYLKGYEFVVDDKIYNEIEEITSPQNNTVYTVDGGQTIYYQQDWYEFIMGEDNTGIARVPIEGAINYAGDIIRTNLG